MEKFKEGEIVLCRISANPAIIVDYISVTHQYLIRWIDDYGFLTQIRPDLLIPIAIIDNLINDVIND